MGKIEQGVNYFCEHFGDGWDSQAYFWREGYTIYISMPFIKKEARKKGLFSKALDYFMTHFKEIKVPNMINIAVMRALVKRNFQLIHEYNDMVKEIIPVMIWRYK